MKVSLFVTCLVDQLYPDVGMCTARLLQSLGCEVNVPKGQVCCGQPAFNSGYVASARKVALNNLLAFEGADYVVSPSGSCTGMMHHYYHELFADDPALAEATEVLTSKTYELSQFVVNVLGITDVGAQFPHTVTYHPSCHGSRILGVKDEPLALLNAVRDITLKPLEMAQDCCGFGGTFAVKMSDVSGAMVSEKAGHVVDTKAEYLVGTDMGCLMNISGCLKRAGHTTKALHLAQLLTANINSPAALTR
jgi:L-lactate dehydrogenase complex protein LldE